MNTNDTKKPVAYDYDAQRWVEGEEAVKLLAAQRAEEADLMDNPRARPVDVGETLVLGGGAGADFLLKRVA